MSLIVSVRTPDGIVIASDSLLSAIANEKGRESPITFSNTQKILPFYEKYAVGIVGAGLIANKSVFSVIRLFEQKLKETNTSFDGVTDIAQKIGDHIHNLLKDQLAHENKNVSDLEPGKPILGLLIIGYDDTNPITVEVHVGEEVQCNVRKEYGCTYMGNGKILQLFWRLYKEHPENQPVYPLLSLQDSVDYAEFLIQTTILHQRFSRTTPNVGGDIDVAIITPLNKFQWIRQKPLAEIMEGMSYETDYTR